MLTKGGWSKIGFFNKVFYIQSSTERGGDSSLQKAQINHFYHSTTHSTTQYSWCQNWRLVVMVTVSNCFVDFHSCKEQILSVFTEKTYSLLAAVGLQEISILLLDERVLCFYTKPNIIWKQTASWYFCSEPFTKYVHEKYPLTCTKKYMKKAYFCPPPPKLRVYYVNDP